ncbi:hypothetical protein [Vibrio quintilis]|uniref:hypothetical protein n=1 Tax=Vibrio quintilis TaxID=1117707 RepID=UPI0009375546|nr:hypothetical protein [Vibrio quintilis]
MMQGTIQSNVILKSARCSNKPFFTALKYEVNLDKVTLNKFFPHFETPLQSMDLLIIRKSSLMT